MSDANFCSSTGKYLGLDRTSLRAVAPFNPNLSGLDQAACNIVLASSGIGVSRIS